ncbi:hypothetical protein GVN20_05735 [Runella sp. CRIBMP]|uniref:hypothetical protein n=1 Tax=Runella sp. CRIBMP TaxID=2683261 RepID=UPI001413478A|nr:hypothetical protein [Runella sp. CRIBMP]NBB18851.1 hypothetical protein [Runella sp. CRIBMP]
MSIRIENLLKGKVSTFNVLAVIITTGYTFCGVFATIYLLTHISKFDKEALRLIFDFATQNKEIILFALGYLARGRIEKYIENATHP